VKERLDAAGRWLWERRGRGVRALPVLIPVVLVLGVMVRYSATFHVPEHEAPEGFVLQPPPTTRPPGELAPTLPALPGTTQPPLPPNVGFAHLHGTVTGPDGVPVPGAQVHIERAISGQFQAMDVFTDATGRYDATGIGGGRYRVRAYLPPTLAQPRAEVFYLQYAEDRPLDLAVGEFGEPSIAVALAPSPPRLDEPLNVAVRVTGRFVDANGFVRVQPLVGGLVDVTVTGPWSRSSTPGTSVTDADGRVDLQFTCTGLGAAQLQVSVRPTVADVPTVQVVDAPACIDPASLTTTTVADTSTTAGGGTTATTAGPTTTAVEPTTTG
jgi:hypothetical protein